FEDVMQIRGTQLVCNEKDHTPFAFMEKNGQIYRRVDCTLVVKENFICENCFKLKKTLQQIQQRILTGVNSTKTIHASKEILIEKVNQQRLIIKEQKKIIINLKERLNQKIKNEEEEVSIEMVNIAQVVSKKVNSKKIEISNLHPIFQELIRIQIGKSKGTRYHPMFLRWAISVYSRSGFTAYNAMKMIMRLLWNQRKNCYVGYLDFENEIDEYQKFALQCKYKIESITMENNSKPDCVLPNKQKHNLATQVHQFIWYSITHNFSFPISYYGINNITVHNLNTLIFELAAKLECIGIHTLGSLCDGAGENRSHIKSFDWYASKWTLGDIVEVNFNKDKKSFHIAKILSSNFEKTKFIVIPLDNNNSEPINIERIFIRKIINQDLIELVIEIPELMQQWKIIIQHCNGFLRPLYNTQELLTNHKTINPITGENWFFISDSTHVFKKLRNNLAKSHTGEKNTREIMFNGKEISWRHIKGVYEHTIQHMTAKATKLIKRHIWLISWSKMRVELAEHTLSKEVEDALESIDELKEISEGTKSLDDERLHTLKEIRNWFIYGDKQKSGPKAWISSQCQFDLILSIDGFIGMLDFLLKKYPGSMIQSKRISQDILEGLFGTIRELGGDSSTHTLKSYGYSLNKYQLSSLFSREVKSINYGSANCIGTGITTLARRKFLDKENNCFYQEHHIRLAQLLPFSRTIFEDLLSENLIMGRIDIPLNLYNENVNSENFKVLQLQKERYDLIETILYQDSINELLEKWKDIIKKMACEAIPKRIGVQWLTKWSSHLEICINNYQCSGIWYKDFLATTNLNGSSTQRLVAYLLL
ncbi:5830_t:CDS:2, partial [Diversispora eburnea]